MILYCTIFQIEILMGLLGTNWIYCPIHFLLFIGLSNLYFAEYEYENRINSLTLQITLKHTNIM